MLTSNSPDRPSANSYWVVPNRLAAGEYPGAWQPAQAATGLKSLLDAGIDHFIDLTEQGELLPYSDGLCKASASHAGSAARGFLFQSSSLSSVPGRYE